MARPATLLAKVDAARATKDRAKAHFADARRAYRAACRTANEGGVNVTQLAAHEGTSWSRMSELLKQAKAEAKGLASVSAEAG